MPRQLQCQAQQLGNSHSICAPSALQKSPVAVSLHRLFPFLGGGGGVPGAAALRGYLLTFTDLAGAKSLLSSPVVPTWATNSQVGQVGGV